MSEQTGRVIYRFEVPVDDQWHEHHFAGDVLHVASRTHGVVEFWAIHRPAVNRAHRLRAYGTGHSLPKAPEVDYVGTALDGLLVWHLMEDRRG